MKTVHFIAFTFSILLLSSCGKASADKSKTQGSNSSGTFDELFYANFGTGFNGNVNALAYAGNEQVLVGGDFSAFKGSTLLRLAKINQKGELDNTFKTNIGSGFNASVRALAVATDGGYIVGGDFTSFNGVPVSRLVKLTREGALNTSFMSQMASGPNDRVNTIHIDSAGNIFIGGNFNQVSFRSSPGIAKLSANGTLDMNFSAMIGTGTTDGVYAIQSLSSSKILVGGKFSSFNFSNAKGIVTLNANGTTDGSFLSIASNAFNDGVYAITQDSSLGFILAGAFTNFSIYSPFRLLRTNSNFGLGSNYTPSGGGFNAAIKTLMLQGDGKLVLGGEFTTFAGQTRNYIVRLNENLSLDDSFQSALGTGPSGAVNAVCSDAEGKVYLGGSFTSFNSNVVGYLVRLK